MFGKQQKRVSGYQFICYGILINSIIYLHGQETTSTPAPTAGFFASMYNRVMRKKPQEEEQKSIPTTPAEQLPTKKSISTNLTTQQPLGSSATSVARNVLERSGTKPPSYYDRAKSGFGATLETATTALSGLLPYGWNGPATQPAPEPRQTYTPDRPRISEPIHPSLPPKIARPLLPEQISESPAARTRDNIATDEQITSTELPLKESEPILQKEFTRIPGEPEMNLQPDKIPGKKAFEQTAPTEQASTISPETGAPQSPGAGKKRTTPQSKTSNKEPETTEFLDISNESENQESQETEQANAPIKKTLQDQLSEAILAANLELCKELLEKGAKANNPDSKGYRPLQLATIKSNSEIAELLLEHGANPNVQNKLGDSPLHEAAKQGNNDIIELLIAKGADVHKKNRFGKTPLAFAQAGEFSDTEKLLLEKGALQPAKKTLEEDEEKPSFLKTLKKSKPKKPTPEELQKKEAEKKENLMKAIRARKLEEVEKFLSGVDPNFEDAQGFTPLQAAAKKGDEKIVKLLLGKKADINQADAKGRTPLYYAAQNGYTSMVKLLINKGANISSSDEHELTPLHMAAINGNSSIAEVLIKKGANVNALDQDGNSALHFAAQNGHLKLVTLLLKNSADRSLKNRQNKTALDLATKREHPEVVLELQNESIKGQEPAEEIEHAITNELGSKQEN